MLIIHIGMPKTGTSSIQKSLYNSRHSLRYIGYRYPYEFCNVPYDYGHNTLASDVLYPMIGSSDRICKFLKFLEKSKQENILLSAEQFCNSFDSESIDLFLIFIKECSKITKVNLILVVRRMDMFLDSAYRQEVVSETTKIPISDYVNLRFEFIKQFFRALQYIIDVCSIKCRIIPYHKCANIVTNLSEELMWPEKLVSELSNNEFVNNSFGLKQSSFLLDYDDIKSSLGLNSLRKQWVDAIFKKEFEFESDIFDFSLLNKDIAGRVHQFALDSSSKWFPSAYSEFYANDIVEDRVSQTLGIENLTVDDFEKIRLYDSILSQVGESINILLPPIGIDENISNYDHEKTINVSDKDKYLQKYICDHVLLSNQDEMIMNFFSFLINGKSIDHIVRYVETFLRLRKFNLIDKFKSIAETGGFSCISEWLDINGYNIIKVVGDFRYEIEHTSESVDILFSLEVFEHIKDQEPKTFDDIVLFNFSGIRQYASECMRVLKPGGVLVLTTPNLCSLVSIARSLSFENPFIYYNHVKEYAPDDIKFEFSNIGFELLEFDTFFSYFYLDDRLQQIEKVFSNQEFSRENRGDTSFFIFRKLCNQSQSITAYPA